MSGLGVAYDHLGEVRKAIGYYRAGVVIVREIGDRYGEGNALCNLGLAYDRLGEVRKAIGYYEQALVISVRSRTGTGRATPCATWAWPTQTWARWRRRSGTTSRRW